MDSENRVTRKAIYELIQKQNYRCAITKRKLTPKTAALDHIVAVSRGGTHSMDNLWIVHHAVNLSKGTMTMEEFVKMCREVVENQPEATVDDPVANDQTAGGKQSIIRFG